jgi:serine/threonine protein kinase
MDTVKIKQPMPEADQCPQCGTPLSPGALAGLCPACLLKAGTADTVTDARQPSFTPPGVGELAAKFPQLEILELIGQGGMGAVYKARQKQLDRIVALKILPPNISSDATFAERFTREARALAKLNHPNIVTLYEFGETSGQFYFLMEFVDGVNLRQLLNNSRLSAREALAIVPQICDALQFAHDHGIVHRDIKPENILLDRRGRVKVADFGLAKIIGGESGEPAASGQSSVGSTTLTDAGKVMGTPRYMSPEQKENPGEVDHRADIYALGVVFYQMLTGELPGKRIEPPSKKVQIDVRLDEIVLRALEKKPELRFQQASVFKTQLETISAEPDQPDLQNSKSSVKPRLSRTAMLRTAWIAIVAIVVLFIIRNHYTPPPTTLSQSEFLSLFQSNQIVHATINLGGQTSQLTPINGTYLKTDTDKDGKVTKEEVQFIAPNVFFTQKMLDELLVSDRIEAGAPNAMLMNVIWGIAPLIFLGIIFLVIPGIIIYVIWRAMRKRATGTVPPLLNKSETFLRWFAVTTLAMIVVLLVIAMLGLIAAVAIPSFVKAREHAQALHQQQMEAATQAETPSNFSIGQAYFPRGDSIEITSVERNEDQITVHGHYHLVSADNATLTLNITTRAPSHHSQDPKQSLEIVNGEGDFELIHSHVEPGMPHVNMYYSGRPFAELYFGTKEEAAREANLDLQHEQLELMDDATLGFNPVIQTVVEFGGGDTGYNLDHAKIMDVMDLSHPGANLVIGRSGNGIDSLCFVGIRAELMPDGDARWHMAAWVLATNLALIPESPDAFTNVFGLSWHEAVMPQSSTHPETYEFQTLEGNTGVLQILGTNASPPGVKIRYKLVRKTIGSPVSSPSADDNQPAAAKTWSPTFAPGEKPDMTRILTEARTLMNQGKFDEALQRQVWYYNHALEYDPSQASARLVTALSQWADLDRLYPKAQDALFVIRDQEARRLEQGKGDADLFSEIEIINNELVDTDATYTLYQAIRQQYPQLAAQCYLSVESLLVAHGDYQWCYDHMGDPQSRFDQILGQYEMSKTWEKTRVITAPTNETSGLIVTPPDSLAIMKKSAVGQVRQLIEILVGAGHQDEAVAIDKQAMSVLDDERLTSAVSDAENKIKQRQQPLTDLPTEPPKLQFLAWQDDWVTNQFGAAWHPDGSPATNALDRLYFQTEWRSTTSFANKPDLRFLELWFSHPLFGPNSMNDVTLLDENGKELSSEAYGGGEQTTEGPNDAPGWLRSTICAGEGTDIPTHVTVHMRYAIGPLEHQMEIAVTNSSNSSTSLEGESELNGVGQNADGFAFVSIAVNTTQMASRKFGVLAMTKDGRELEPTSADSTGFEGGPGVRAERYNFSVSLADVEKFIIGTRPIRIMEWKNIVLLKPGGTLLRNENSPLTASAETWSPELKSGEKPDLQKIRDQIQSLMNSGDYEGALQRQIWYFNHALEFGEVDPVRLSFGIMNWAELGHRYPKAKLALTEIRDRDVQQFASGNGYFALFSEIENINRELQDENSTEALFHSLEQSDPKLAQQCYPVIADQLAQRGEYETCRKYMGDPLTQFEIIRSEYELNLENQKHMAFISQITARQMAATNHQPNRTNPWSPPDNSAFLKRNAENNFIRQTRQLIEILVATDNDLSAAQDIQNKALSVLNVPQLQSAVSDAEEKIRAARRQPANK